MLFAAGSQVPEPEVFSNHIRHDLQLLRGSIQLFSERGQCSFTGQPNFFP